MSGITLKLTATRIGTLRHADVGLPHGTDGASFLAARRVELREQSTFATDFIPLFHFNCRWNMEVPKNGAGYRAAFFSALVVIADVVAKPPQSAAPRACEQRRETASNRWADRGSEVFNAGISKMMPMIKAPRMLMKNAP